MTHFRFKWIIQKYFFWLLKNVFSGGNTFQHSNKNGPDILWKSKVCNVRESNPGLPRGRREFYHWTNVACCHPWLMSFIKLFITFKSFLTFTRIDCTWPSNQKIRKSLKLEFGRTTHTVLRQRLTHFNSAQNLKMRQSLACQFLTTFSRFCFCPRFVRVILTEYKSYFVNDFD